MHKTSDAARARSGAVYHERLSPSLWTIVSAGVVAPMAALVFVPLDTTLSLVVGVAVAVAVVILLLAASPVVEVRDGELRTGRAHIPVGYLGVPVVLTGDEARFGRGPGLDARAWHLIRGSIDGLARFPVTDADDPHSEWVIASRTPDRLAAAVRSAQLRRSTPRR